MLMVSLMFSIMICLMSLKVMFTESEELHVQDERYKYSYTGNNNQTLSKEVLLNDTDPLYKQLKHMHIAELSTHLHAEYKQFLEDNKAAQNLSKGATADLKAMVRRTRPPDPRRAAQPARP